MVNPSFYVNNRERFAAALPDRTAALLFSGEEKQMSLDSDYRFFADRNFFYLTGLERPGFVLVIEKFDGKVTSRVYAPAHDSKKERWHGKRMDFADIAAIAGLDAEDVLDLEKYEEKEYELIRNTDINIYLDASTVMSKSKELRKQIEKDGRKASDLSEITTPLRMIKSQHEIDSIKEAARITEEAIAEMKKLIKPGVSEYELYLKLEYEMARRSSMSFAFETIVSCGRNAFYLHHSDPERDGDGIAKEGSIIQIDCGARMNGCCADISRVFFVGKPEGENDKRILLLGLIQELRKAAFGFIAPEKTFAGLNSQMYDITGKWLAGQGLIPDNFTDEDVKCYYWHNTSHYLGMDVHDVGPRDKEFEAGNCLAVEPGVYIPEWDIGFRIEDDCLVTENGCQLLSSGCDSPEGIIVG
ncbi:MAG: aminopeptidase P family protein [Clostridiales bacterium]|nr:aminopeptidase P family protein [Clostridiales bacterium]